MAKTIDALHADLEALRREFEMYFMGHEKRMPARKRDQLKRDIQSFQPGRDAVERFKHQNLVQRWMTAERYWQRILKAIEDGRYERDVQKARLRDSWKKNEAPREATPERAARANARAREVGDEAAAFMASLTGGPASVPMRGAPKAGPPVPMRGAPKADGPAVPMRGRPRGTNSAPPRPARPSAPPRQARPSAPPRPARPSAPPRQARPSAPARPIPAPPAQPSPGLRGRPVADADRPPLRVPLRGRSKDRDDSP